jgi:hypothetical protein
MLRRNKLFIALVAGVFLIVSATIYYRDYRPVINGSSVTPMPLPWENNKTLLGVDVNNNGVRDDIERYIAEKFGDNPENFRHVMKYEQLTEYALAHSIQGLDKTLGETASQYSVCVPHDNESHVDLNAIEWMLRNSPQREYAFAVAFSGTHGPIAGDRCTD